MQRLKLQGAGLRRGWQAVGLLLLAGACVAAADEEPAVEAAASGAALQGTTAGAVVAWNELGHRIAYEEDQFLTFKGQRALAMMNLAMHDAVNTIQPVFERYHLDVAPRSANPELAAAHAAHDVLHAQYPGAVAALDSLLAVMRGRTPHAAHGAAAELGGAAARTILATRAGDDWDAPGTYAFATGAGRYQTTPDWDGFVLQPGFRDARPFALASPDAFRPPPPPALASDAYAVAFAEVKRQGGLGSTARTEDQSGYAVWWMEFAEGSVNRLARRLAMERGLDLWDSARLFALLHVALFDAYVATWDAKYAYNHWRPYTAIRAGADDGNAATAGDADWESLLPAPPFPEYASAHAAGCAAAFAVLESEWGNSVPFTMGTTTAPEGMPERSFRGFSAATEECADSRVQLGWHFRYATDAGAALGRRVADHVLRTTLRQR